MNCQLFQSKIVSLLESSDPTNICSNRFHGKSKPTMAMRLLICLGHQIETLMNPSQSHNWWEELWCSDVFCRFSPGFLVNPPFSSFFPRGLFHEDRGSAAERSQCGEVRRLAPGELAAETRTDEAPAYWGDTYLVWTDMNWVMYHTLSYYITGFTISMKRVNNWQPSWSSCNQVIAATVHPKRVHVRLLDPLFFTGKAAECCWWKQRTTVKLPTTCQVSWATWSARNQWK